MMRIFTAWATISSAGKFFTVVTGVLLGVLLIAVLETKRPLPHSKLANSNLNQAAVLYAAYIVEDDVQSGLSGAETVVGSSSQENFLNWAQLDGRTSARDYESAYDANEISADNRFKGKKLLLSGVIGSVEKDFTGQGYLMLRGSEPFLGVRAGLSDRSTSEAASFSRGQRISLVCAGGGRIATLAMLDHCKSLSEHMDEISSVITSRVKGFLSGEVALKRPDAEAITFAYVIAQSLPADSQCVRGLESKCKAETFAALHDPASVKSIKEHSASLLASLRVLPD